MKILPIEIEVPASGPRERARLLPGTLSLPGPARGLVAGKAVIDFFQAIPLCGNTKKFLRARGPATI